MAYPFEAYYTNYYVITSVTIHQVLRLTTLHMNRFLFLLLPLGPHTVVCGMFDVQYLTILTGEEYFI